MIKSLRVPLGLVLLTSILCTATYSQPVPVKQIPENSANFKAIGNFAYFTVDDELWRTDGTASGTFLLKSGFDSFSEFQELNGRLYFRSEKTTSQNSYGWRQLWSSDGTPSGTVLLKTSSNYDITIAGATPSYVFFGASDALSGYELYRTTGTPSGTAMVADINPGSGRGFVGFSAAMNGILLFAGNDGITGQELWKSDGTTAGTVLVKDIKPGPEGGFAGSSQTMDFNVFSFENLFYFRGVTEESGSEPWVSNGTPEGTRILRDIVPGFDSPGTIQYEVTNGDRLYTIIWPGEDSEIYTGAADLWTTSGTMESTVKIMRVGDNTGHNEYHHFENFLGKVYFFDRAEYSEDNLWVSDGTVAGTHVVTGLTTMDGGISVFAQLGDNLAFAGTFEALPTPYYRTDGNSGESVFYRRKALGHQDGKYDYSPRLAVVDNLGFLADHDGLADNGENYSREDYFHLFETDGFTTRSMRTLWGINTIGTSNIINYNGKVLFTTQDNQYGPTNSEKKLWIYDPKNRPGPAASFTLVDANADEDIKRLIDSSSFRNPNDLPVNIRFDPASRAGSVVFQLNGQTVRTENAAPYSLAGDVDGDYAPWQGAVAGTYHLTAQAYSDSGGKGTLQESLSITFTIECEYEDNCLYTGAILYEQWHNIEGSEVSSIPVDTKPDGTSLIAPFEARTNTGISNYGARVRGYVIPAASGDYTFWIASDDNSELWLSTDDDPVNKRKIASVTGFTDSRQWDKYASQKSGTVTLSAGRKYYIEALQKQSTGADNLAVGWQLPNGSMERPIPRQYLSPFKPNPPAPPVARMTQPTEGQIFEAPADIKLVVEATASEGQTIAKVEFFGGTEAANMRSLGEDTTYPYELLFEDVPAGDWEFNAFVTDSYGNQTGVRSVNVTVTETGECVASGTILREYWSNIQGNTVSSIPVDKEPTATSQLTIFEGPSNIGTNYGDRIRGYICPPSTGTYVFWIASNDHSELWLSTDDNPVNKRKIAYIIGATDPRQWNKYPTQKSAPITLTAGKKYYVESLHKQGAGTDHVSVGWQLPDGALERPIPGASLSPFEEDGQQTLTVNMTSPQEGETFTAPADILLEAEASNAVGPIAKVEFWQRLTNAQEFTKIGEDATSPYSFMWTDVAEGSYELFARVYDGAGASQTSPYRRILVTAGGCTASGFIVREYWNNIQGNTVDEIPVNSPPSGTEQLDIFEGPTNSGINYGARVRGYICPPVTGGYTFWIASNDHSELWLSTDNNPANKKRIAWLDHAAGPRDWYRYLTQQSVVIQLRQGQRYYIEALHKQGIGGDNLAVGWQLPDFTMERPIPGGRLSPFETNDASMSLAAEQTTGASEFASQVELYPNPAPGGSREFTIAGYESLETSVETDVEIINTTGDVVYSEHIRCGGDCGSYLVKMDKQLVPGLYLVKMRTNGSQHLKRLLVR